MAPAWLAWQTLNGEPSACHIFQTFCVEIVAKGCMRSERFSESLCRLMWVFGSIAGKEPHSEGPVAEFFWSQRAVKRRRKESYSAVSEKQSSKGIHKVTKRVDNGKSKEGNRGSKKMKESQTTIRVTKHANNKHQTKDNDNKQTK